jgi:FKBP-type peptidyl-prolyl cis-trans isomerase
MMKNSLILWVALIAAFAVTSCQNDKGGFKTTKDGLKYKFYVQNDTGAMPKEGDWITLNMINRTDDTVFFKSSDSPVPMEIPMAKSQFPGDIYDAFAMMHTGDSATFIISTDSLFKNTRQALPPWLEKAKYIYFDVLLLKVKTKDEVMAEQKAMEEKRKAEAEENKAQEVEKIQKYLKDNNITVKPLESGLYVVIEKQGKGKRAKAGDDVTVDYTGYLLDGTKFDSSKDHGQPFTFKLGAGRVIKGWDEGVAKLNVGGKAKLIIPSNLAYGERGAGGVIPPYAPLVFDVELIKAETPPDQK